MHWADRNAGQCNTADNAIEKAKDGDILLVDSLSLVKELLYRSYEPEAATGYEMRYDNVNEKNRI